MQTTVIVVISFRTDKNVIYGVCSQQGDFLKEI